MHTLEDSSIWTHEMFVIEPRTIKHRNTTLFYTASLAAGCNSDKPIIGPLNLDIFFLDMIAYEAEMVGVIMF